MGVPPNLTRSNWKFPIQPLKSSSLLSLPISPTSHKCKLRKQLMMLLKPAIYRAGIGYTPTEVLTGFEESVCSFSGSSSRSGAARTLGFRIPNAALIPTELHLDKYGVPDYHSSSSLALLADTQIYIPQGCDGCR